MKIICVGRNYPKHAEELGNEVPDEPVLFMKADSSLMRQRDAFYIPDFTNEVHFEAEIVLKINRLGKQIESRFADKYFAQFTIGIDFTARDVQDKLKAKGLPWEKAKAFDGSAVTGNWLNAAEYDLKNLGFELRINGETVQKGNTGKMIFPMEELVAHASKYFTLKIGDLLFTGTPEGVGPVAPGDVLEGFVEGQKVLKVVVR